MPASQFTCDCHVSEQKLRHADEKTSASGVRATEAPARPSANPGVWRRAIYDPLSALRVSDLAGAWAGRTSTSARAFPSRNPDVEHKESGKCPPRPLPA